MEEKMEEKKDFYDCCEKSGIHVFIGMVLEQCPSDIGIVDVDEFLEYCVLNEIKGIFLHYEFQEKEELDAEQIRTKLTNFYNNQLKKFPYSEAYLPKHITADFFTSALSQTLDELAKDDTIITQENGNKEESDEQEDEIISVEAWAIHSGCRVFTRVFVKDEDDQEEQLTEKAILDKYAHKILTRLERLKDEAAVESERIEKESHKKILDEIWYIIWNNQELGRMKTQKERYEFADRIQIQYQEEKECDWLTKKQVRSMVDYRYMKITE